jgi:hypothetical protein
MDFSLGCKNRCRQQDGFQSRVQNSVQATGWISVYGAKLGAGWISVTVPKKRAGNWMDFSIGCKKR